MKYWVAGLSLFLLFIALWLLWSTLDGALAVVVGVLAALALGLSIAVIGRRPQK